MNSSSLQIHQPNQNSSASSSVNYRVTPTEFAVIRSLFGRSEDAHGSAADAPTKLLPHVDLRWLTGALQNNKFNYSSSLSNNNSNSNSTMSYAMNSGAVRFQENTASSTKPPSTVKNISNLFGNIEAVSNNWTRRDYTSLANGNSTSVMLPNTNHSSSSETHRSSRLVSSSSSLAAPAGSAHALILINSPRSAVTLLRTGTDLHQLVTQVAAAHSISVTEARQASATTQRITSDSDHQHLARQRRRQLEVQEQVRATLQRLAAVYRAICDATSWDDIFAMRDAECGKRQVLVPPAHPEYSKHRATHNERSFSAMAMRRAAASEKSNARIAALEANAATQSKVDEAIKRKKQLDAQKQNAEAEKTIQRHAVHHSQMRSRVLSDILKRESAALQCQRVYNMEKTILK